MLKQCSFWPAWWKNKPGDPLFYSWFGKTMFKAFPSAKNNRKISVGNFDPFCSEPPYSAACHEAFFVLLTWWHGGMVTYKAWKVVRSIAALHQQPRTPRNWRCAFAFLVFPLTFQWTTACRGYLQVFKVFFFCQNQENVAWKQWTLHAPCWT